MSKRISYMILGIMVLSFYGVGFGTAYGSSQTYYINADGSVSPNQPANLAVSGDTYTFTGDIEGNFVVNRPNVIIDGAGFSLIGDGSTIAGIDLWGLNVTVINLRITGFGASGVSASHDCLIANNTITGNRGGISIANAHQKWIVIYNNTIEGNGEGMRLHGNATYMLIRDNTINNNTDEIYCSYCSNLEFFGNLINGTSDGSGIRLFNCENITLSRNTISSNDLHGVLLQNVNGFAISDNDFSGNGGAGLVLGSSSATNRVLGNNFTSNGQSGLQILGTSATLLVAQNNFNNAKNVEVASTSVVWVNGYPSGGNYWSDYGGEDLFSGENQDVTGSDGIGDTPHQIKAGIQDGYPLMEPYVSEPAHAYVLIVTVKEGATCIVDATVTIDAVSKSTGIVCEASFYDLPLGTYDYLVTKEGYEPQSGSVTLAVESETKYLSIQLSRISLDNKTTTQITCQPSAPSLYFSWINVESFKITGAITPAVNNVEVTIVITDPKGVQNNYTADTDAEGRYGYEQELERGQGGEWKAQASWEGNGEFEGAASPVVAFYVNQPCIIATAAYGSEMHPEVVNMRSFRDEKVASSFTGSNFVGVFHAWYYSWSPFVAGIISGDENMKYVARVILTPLAYSMRASEAVFDALSFSTELAASVSILVAASLCGAFYITPIFLAVPYTRKVRVDWRQVLCLISVLGSIMLIGLAVQSYALNAVGITAFAVTLTCLVGISASRMLIGLFKSLALKLRGPRSSLSNV